MKTELTNSARPLNRKDIKALITRVLNNEKVLSDRINGPVFRAEAKRQVLEEQGATDEGQV